MNKNMPEIFQFDTNISGYSNYNGDIYRLLIRHRSNKIRRDYYSFRKYFPLLKKRKGGNHDIHHS